MTDGRSVPEAVVDLAALAANVARLTTRVNGRRIMGVVKGDAYGHGLLPVARTLVDLGIDSLGVATLAEANRLRRGGVPARVRILAWLYSPSAELPELEEAVRSGVDLSVGSSEHLAAVAAVAARINRTAHVQLQFDSGLGRGGVEERDWADFITQVAVCRAAGRVEPVGLWTHLSFADVPNDRRNEEHLERFRLARAVAERAGLRFDTVHSASSARALTTEPDDRDGETVRIGLSLFGVSPIDGVAESAWGLEPVLTVRAPIVQVKRVTAGERVGYGQHHLVDHDGYIGLVPVGFADGVPKHAETAPVVLVGEERRVIAGTVNMDQFMVDLGADAVPPGTVVTILGRSVGGAVVSANDWGAAIGSFGDEIVTRLGSGLPRRYTDAGRLPSHGRSSLAHPGEGGGEDGA